VGNLQLPINWVRVIDSSPFKHLETFIVTFFGTHDDGKIQPRCLVLLGRTLVHYACCKQKVVMKCFTEAD
jgi:hypothetical protein